MDEFLQSAGIRLLRDQAVLIDNCFYLYGRPDAQRVAAASPSEKHPLRSQKTLTKKSPSSSSTTSRGNWPSWPKLEWMWICAVTPTTDRCSL